MKRSKETRSTISTDDLLEAATGGFGFCEVTGMVVGEAAGRGSGLFGPIVGPATNYGVTSACNWAKNDMASGGSPGDIYIPPSYDTDTGTVHQAWFFEPGMTP